MGDHSRVWEVRWAKAAKDGWQSIRLCNRDMAELLAEKVGKYRENVEIVEVRDALLPSA